MPQTPRTKFKTTQDWHNFINQARTENRPITPRDLSELRKACYRDIEAERERPLIVYATKFIDGGLPQAPNNIDLADIEGFTSVISNLPSSEEVDVLIHSPGGRADATERIVNILRGKFKKVHFLVPHSAYSAATMLALSGDTVVLHNSATLGPIDPQIDGIPARSIKKGFERIKDKVKEEGAESLPAYIPLIEKYSLHLLEICDDAEKLSKELVGKWLKEYMFAGEEGHDDDIERVVSYFSSYDTHLVHSRPISLQKIQELEADLKISAAEETLQELLWEAFILLNGFFSMTPFIKLYENTHGISWGHQFQIMMGGPAPMPPVQPQNPPGQG